MTLALALLALAGLTEQPSFYARGVFEKFGEPLVLIFEAKRPNADFEKLIQDVPYSKLHVSFECKYGAGRLIGCRTKQPNVRIPQRLKLEKFVEGLSVAGRSPFPDGANGRKVIGAFSLSIPGKPEPPKFQCQPFLCTRH